MTVIFSRYSIFHNARAMPCHAIPFHSIGCVLGAHLCRWVSSLTLYTPNVPFISPSAPSSGCAVLILRLLVTPAKCMRPSLPRLVFCVQLDLRASQSLALSCDRFCVLGKPVCVSACLIHLVAPSGDSQVCRPKHWASVPSCCSNPV